MSEEQSPETNLPKIEEELSKISVVDSSSVNKISIPS